MSAFSKWIENRNWDHGKFLTVMLLVMLLLVLVMALQVVIWTNLGLISEVTLKRILVQAGRGLLSGILMGAVLVSVFLLRYYLRKEWDLHIVVPNSLMIGLFVVASSLGLPLLPLDFDPFFSAMFSIGAGIGVTFAISAYITEVKKEHQ